jgi:hypothetical protein
LSLRKASQHANVIHSTASWCFHFKTRRFHSKH